MKKLIFSVFAVLAAATLALAGGPGLRFGSLTESGKIAPADLKAVHSLELDVPENGQSVAEFTIEVFKAGKIFSRATIQGSEIHEEMRVVMSRLKMGDRVVLRDVVVKNASGTTERLGETMQIDVL